MDKTSKFWDQASRSFDKNEIRFASLNKKILDSTKRYLEKDFKILDFACGTGAKTIKLSDYADKIIGIDISSKMIESAKSKVTEKNIENIDFIKMSIQDDILEKNSFDVILAFNILHLLEDNQQLLQRIYELLKDGGLFISVTPCLKEKIRFLINIPFVISILLSKIGLIPIYLQRFSKSDLDSLLLQNKFTIAASEIYFDKFSNYFVVASKQNNK